MDQKKQNNQEIKKYLLENPKYLNSRYSETARLFNTTYEAIRSIARRIRKNSEQPKEVEKKSFVEHEDTAIITCEDSTRVKSLDQLIKACNVDLTVWEVDKYDIGTYEVTGFDKDRKPVTITMFRTKAWLKKINPLLDINKIRKELVEDLKSIEINHKKINYDLGYKDDDEHLLEISAFDLHLGKIGIAEDKYSLKIASERMMKAVEHLLKRSSGYYINQILLIVGHDLLNADGDWPVPSTTKGTPQFNTDKHLDIYRAARKLLISAVNYLSEVAPVHIMVVPGNHDKESMMHIGDALEIYYESSEDVTVDNSLSMMKGYHYGKCLVISDHGDGAKVNDLPGIVSQRYRKIWSDVRHVEVHRGHLHTNKATKLQAVEELQGLTIRNLSSLAATDEWHDAKGYIGNIKKASAFVWSKYNGLQAKLNYNVKI